GGTLADGSHSLTVVATDAAGNSTTQTLTFTLDAAAPSITAALANDTGVSATDRITSDDTVSGKIGDATDNIVTFKAGLDGTANGTSVLAALNADGSFTLTPKVLQVLTGGALADGAHTLHLLATDAAGNTGTFDLSFLLDASGPTITAALAHDTGVNQLTGAPISGLTNDPTIAGTVADSADRVVTLRVAVDGGSTTDVSGMLGANGSFRFDQTLLTTLAGGALADGQHTVHVTALDQAGNASQSDVTFTLKTTPPATPTFALAPTDQSAAALTQTAASTVTLTGQSDPGVAITLTLANGTTLSTVTDTKGHFQFGNVALAPGANTLSAQATDDAGNTSKFTITLQHNAPTSSQSDSVLQWDQITLQAIQSAADDPIVASRVLALESLAVYDTINSIDGTQSYFVHLDAPADTLTDAAVAAAAHEVLSKLYPAEQSALDALFAQSLNAIPNGQGKIDGVALGTQIADDILALRASDGSQITAVDPGSTVAGQWRPTGPDFNLALSPQFANVTPFALNSADQFLSSIAPPPALDSAAYAAAVQEVDTLGSLNSTQRTADQTQIAQFWAGGLGSVTIGGQWNQIAAQVAQQAGDSEGEDARLFAELNVGLADTGVATWNAKYNFNLWSPVTAIQSADPSVNPALTADPKFTPLVTTPQAPEYVETQASFSAAAADILTSFFGNNVSFTAASTAANGGTRSFTSFSQAAQEAGSSGIFAGTDFQFSNVAGQALGKSVGDFVLQAFNTAKPADPPRIALNAPSGAAPTSTTTNIVTNTDPVISGAVLDNLSG
ncbi:MAG: hypothetical protein J2P55_10310, partial [Rhizobiales bacterium]|nr:hypothetical protein [Hyphomicrobiales bacterium]